MEVLLRSDYKWEPAHFNVEAGTICLENGNAIAQTYIVSIRDDERRNYVVCKNCGQIILNTPETLEEHYNQCNDSRACFTCRFRRDSVIDLVSKNYELNADGTYNRIVTDSVNLSCGMGTFNGPDINSENARRNCQYAQCRAKGVKDIEDVFISHPGVFDDITTVDALDVKRWTFEKIERGFYLHKAKTRYRLYAAVNQMGIIDHFVYKYNAYTHKFVYSAKYDKIFMIDGGVYSEPRNGYNIIASSEKIAEITKEVAKIYKE